MQRQQDRMRQAAEDQMRDSPFSNTPPGPCMVCRAWSSVGVPGNVMSGGPRWLCPDCWLCREPVGPFLAVAKEIGAWPSLEELFTMLAGPQHLGPPIPPRRDLGPPTLEEEEGCALVFWDALDAFCASLAHALWHEFHDVCAFVEAHDRGAVGRALVRREMTDCSVLLAHVCVPDVLTVVLPSGVYILGCEKHQFILLMELHYLQRVHPPAVDTVRALESEYLEPINRVASLPCSVSYDWWWSAPQAIVAIARSLNELCFAIIDDFLPDSDFEYLASMASKLYDQGDMYHGRLDQGGSYFGDAVRDEFLNSEGIPMKWEAWGNHKTFCGDCDPRAPGIWKLPAATDKLISLLKGVGHGVGSCVQSFSHAAPDDIPAAVCERLQPASFRESVMVATYRANTRGRYLRHTDVGRNSVITCLYYPNRGWCAEDAGQCRIFGPGVYNTEVKYDVAPVGNRLLIFWADADVPHEVLHTKRDRYGMTVWYVTGMQALSGPSGFLHLMQNLQPVAPLSVAGALQRMGIDQERARHVEKIHHMHNKHGGGANSLALREVHNCGLCARCGSISTEGRQGKGHLRERWFCVSCCQGDCHNAQMFGHNNLQS